MPRRNRNIYAALAAARRGDWAAVMQPDNLDLLDERMLNQVLGQARNHPDRSSARQAAINAVLDELHRCQIDAAHAEEMGR